MWTQAELQNELKVRLRTGAAGHVQAVLRVISVQRRSDQRVELSSGLSRTDTDTVLKQLKAQVFTLKPANVLCEKLVANCD